MEPDVCFVRVFKYLFLHFRAGAAADDQVAADSYDEEWDSVDTRSTADLLYSMAASSSPSGEGQAATTLGHAKKRSRKTFRQAASHTSGADAGL